MEMIYNITGGGVTLFVMCWMLKVLWNVAGEEIRVDNTVQSPQKKGECISFA